jgi:hypothetical protein
VQATLRETVENEGAVEVNDRAARVEEHGAERHRFVGVVH